MNVITRDYMDYIRNLAFYVVEKETRLGKEKDTK